MKDKSGSRMGDGIQCGSHPSAVITNELNSHFILLAFSFHTRHSHFISLCRFLCLSATKPSLGCSAHFLLPAKPKPVSRDNNTIYWYGCIWCIGSGTYEHPCFRLTSHQCCYIQQDVQSWHTLLLLRLNHSFTIHPSTHQLRPSIMQAVGVQYEFVGGGYVCDSSYWFDSVSSSVHLSYKFSTVSNISCDCWLQFRVTFTQVCFFRPEDQETIMSGAKVITYLVPHRSSDSLISFTFFASTLVGPFLSPMSLILSLSPLPLPPRSWTPCTNTLVASAT